MASVSAGLSTAITTYRRGALVPFDTAANTDDWDAWAARAFRYLHADHYYWNTVYSTLAHYSASHKSELGLYHHIRPIYNPVFRLVEGYVANVWGGNLDFENLTEGAIPLIGVDGPLGGAIRQLWRWSNWGQVKNKAVRIGANKGDVPIKVVADVDRGKVRLEVINPITIQAATFDAVGNVKAVVIGYDRIEGGRRYTYQEKIDGDSFSTYRDGELYAYPENTINGSPVAEWGNPYGFVPLVIVRHRDVTKDFGGSAYANVLPKVDELNDQASKTNDFIRVALNPVWYAAGVNGPDDLELQESDTGPDPASPEKRGLGATVLYGPEGSMMQPLVAQADIAGALGAIDRGLAELEKDLPELALPTIRAQGNMTAPGVRAGWSDAIARYTEARGQYDEGLIRAHMMAISVGAFHEFENFEPFSLESYAAGALEHYVKERPVINDDLSLTERVQALQDSGAPAYLIWELCGLGKDEIEKAWAEKQATERSIAGEFGRAVLGGVLSEPETDGGDL